MPTPWSPTAGSAPATGTAGLSERTYKCLLSGRHGRVAESRGHPEAPPSHDSRLHAPGEYGNIQLDTGGAAMNDSDTVEVPARLYAQARRRLLENEPLRDH